MYSTKSASAYKIHLRRHHPDFPKNLEFGTVINVRDQGESSSSDDDEVFNEEEYQTIALPDDGHVHRKSIIMLLAKYFLSLENDHRETKFSLDNIAISTRQLLSTVLSVLIDKFKNYLVGQGEDLVTINNIISNIENEVQSELLYSCDRFLSSYKRDNTYKELCYVIVPMPVYMGKTNKTVKNK